MRVYDITRKQRRKKGTKCTFVTTLDLIFSCIPETKKKKRKPLKAEEPFQCRKKANPALIKQVWAMLESEVATPTSPLPLGPAPTCRPRAGAATLSQHLLSTLSGWLCQERGCLVSE